MKKDFLNLGRQPIANSFLSSISKKSLKSEYFYNLIISFNTKNFLVSVKKPVNPKTQKGLSKLPTEVRNKMGYMKKGGKVHGK